MTVTEPDPQPPKIPLPLCTFCRVQITQAEIDSGLIDENKVLDSTLELDYIELYHKRCRESEKAKTLTLLSRIFANPEIENLKMKIDPDYLERVIQRTKASLGSMNLTQDERAFFDDAVKEHGECIGVYDAHIKELKAKHPKLSEEQVRVLYCYVSVTCQISGMMTALHFPMDMSMATCALTTALLNQQVEMHADTMEQRQLELEAQLRQLKDKHGETPGDTQ